MTRLPQDDLCSDCRVYPRRYQHDKCPFCLEKPFAGLAIAKHPPVFPKGYQP
jgi:hypothetical protein